jgi:hypothetical protein
MSVFTRKPFAPLSPKHQRNNHITPLLKIKLQNIDHKDYTAVVSDFYGYPVTFHIVVSAIENSVRFWKPYQHTESIYNRYHKDLPNHPTKQTFFSKDQSKQL